MNYQLSVLGFVRDLEGLGCTIEDEPAPDAIFADEQRYVLVSPDGTTFTVAPSQGTALVNIDGDDQRHFLHDQHAAKQVVEALGINALSNVYGHRKVAT